MKKVLFICNANNLIGGGHLFRSISLACTFQENGWEVSLQTMNTCKSYMPLNNNFKSSIFYQKNRHDYLYSISPNHYDVIISDDYSIEECHDRYYRTLSGLYVVIEDSPRISRSCNILINPSNGFSKQDWNNILADKNAFILQGIKYLLLRKEFALKKNAYLANSVKPVEIVLSMGSSAVGIKYTENILFLLSSLREELSLNIIISKCPARLRELVDYYSDNDRLKLELVENPHIISDELLQCSYAIGAAGVNAFERAALGIPSLNICIAQNQRPNYDYLMSKKACLGINFNESEFDEELKKQLDILRKSVSTRFHLSKNSYNLDIRDGAANIFDHLNRACN